VWRAIFRSGFWGGGREAGVIGWMRVGCPRSVGRGGGRGISRATPEI